MAASTDVEHDDMQGLVRFGHGRLEDASYLLLAGRRAGGGPRLAAGGAGHQRRDAANPPPDTALQVAFTGAGLARTRRRSHGSSRRSPRSSSTAWRATPTARAAWATSAPTPRAAGSGAAGAAVPHLVLMLFARQGGLAAWERTIKGKALEQGVQAAAPARHQRHRRHRAVRLRRRPEPARARLAAGAGPGRARDRLEFGNLLALGEVAARLSQRVRPLHRAAAARPGRRRRRRGAAAGRGRPGIAATSAATAATSCFRQLHQDVRGFWQFVDRAAGGDAERRWALADAMVGRRRDGAPLVPPRGRADRRHRPQPARARGQRLHLRRRPRRRALPVRRPHPARQPAHRRPARRRARAWSRGCCARSASSASGIPRRHGGVDPLPPPAAPRPRVWPAADAGGGVAARCRTRSAACTSSALPPTSRGSSSSCRTPGWRAPSSTGWPTRATRCWATASRCSAAGAPTASACPQADGPPRRVEGLPRFVDRARRRLLLPAGDARAALHRRSRGSSHGFSERNRPCCWRCHRALQAGLHVERRLEPFFRRPLNRLAREPSAAVLQWLINLRRPDEGLALAEERDLPDEEDEPAVDHRGLCRLHDADLPAGQLRARRQHQDPRPRPGRGQRSTTACPSICAAASSPCRAPSRPMSASPVPAPTCPTTSTTSASAACRSS